ncbi:MAG: hypothetical protein IPJ57_10735 [Gemmatimonadetes bacterium]|nr:hypothetical protein [Gemmatimonadota bacterium]MBK9066630.1 hypothetical protein [Gemmatimonadota bacterium]MBK9693752.1 hypothetical protein [Gemmatimonadota bacterium]MBP9200883.1 hypothetical protein [Gemmatimonadales bacterium]
MSLFQRVMSRFRAGLDPLEEFILSAVIRALDRDDAQTLKLQLGQVNLIQRHASGKEVNMYRMERGRPAWPLDVLFANRAEEARLATVAFRAKGKGQRYVAHLWLVRGAVFSLEFEARPKTVGVEDLLVEDVEVEPAIGSAAYAPGPQPCGVLPGAWGRLCADFGPCECTPPQESALVIATCERLRIALPGDYRELIASTDGLVCEQFSVVGVGQLSLTVGPRTNDVVLAHIPTRGVIAVAQDGDGVLSLFPFEEDGPRHLGLELSSAIRATLDSMS